MTHVNSSRPLSKPWLPLTDETIAKVSAQLGVFQLADTAGNVVAIGFAGPRDPFGMRSALTHAHQAHPAATQFRYEFTSNYRSRYDELLMQHAAAYASLPAGQEHEQHRIGRLTPAS